MGKSSLFFIALFSLNAVLAQTWETRSDLPSGAIERHHPNTFAIGGTGYLMGGALLSNESLGDFYSYDPVSDAWTTKADFPGLSRG